MALKCFPPPTALIEAESPRSTISSSSSNSSSFEKQNLCHIFLDKRKGHWAFSVILQLRIIFQSIKFWSLWSFALKLDSSSSTIVVLPPCLSIIERSGGSSARLSTLTRFALHHWRTAQYQCKVQSVCSARNHFLSLLFTASISRLSLFTNWIALQNHSALSNCTVHTRLYTQMIF